VGEAVYHLKARWPDAKAAKVALPKVRKFLTDMAKAYEDWQDHRGFPLVPRGEKAKPKAPADYFKVTFPKKHKKVLDMLGIVLHPEDDPSMNQLAGKLDSPISLNAAGDDCIQLQGPIIYIFGEVWHFADWDPIANALTAHFGAKAANWISDEYANVADLVHV
jgi:hypothetical protein